MGTLMWRRCLRGELSCQEHGDGAGIEAQPLNGCGQDGREQREAVLAAVAKEQIVGVSLRMEIVQGLDDVEACVVPNPMARA